MTPQPTSTARTLVVEGWRGIAHSYAMVNQHQLLALQHRPDLRLFHRDIPYAFPNWQPAQGLFTPEQDSRLGAIPAPPTDLRADAVLRMGWPHHFHPDPAGAPVFVWGTSEVQLIEPISIGLNKPARDILPGISCDIIACSNWAAQGFLNSGAPPARVHIVPCGVDTDTFRPLSDADRAAARRELGWEGRFILLNVSAMTPNKGIAFILKAAATLLPQFPALSVVLKGTDALYNSQQQAHRSLSELTPAEAQSIAPRTAYIGNTLSTQQLARMYQAADLYISPYIAEGFNLPVLEAAACGLPVLCTRGGPTDDFVDDSFALRIDSFPMQMPPPAQGSCLMPNYNPLLSQLPRAVRDHAWRAAARDSGPAWARSRFTWSHSVDRLFNVLFPTTPG